MHHVLKDFMKKAFCLLLFCKVPRFGEWKVWLYQIKVWLVSTHKKIWFIRNFKKKAAIFPKFSKVTDIFWPFLESCKFHSSMLRKLVLC